MRISSLQLGLIVAGVVLVVGVLLYNAWVLRRARRARTPAPLAPSTPHARVEPSFGHASDAPREPSFARDAVAEPEAEYADDPAPPAEAPSADDLADLDAPAISRAARDSSADAVSPPTPGERAPAPPSLQRGVRRDTAPQPDPDIESVILYNLAAPVTAAAHAPGMHARLGKPVRWFGRRDSSGAWQRLTPEASGAWTDCAACMLLADRSGAASRNQVEAFARMAAELAPTLPAAFTPPVVADEVARAEALDRLCAELDMQIGITIQRTDGGTIAGTRLRGVAEANGFRLAPNGRYEWVLEDTGAVLYTLQNLSGEPFSNDSLRVSSVSGLVCVLDVPCVVEPARAFDQMKLAAGRLAKTLGGEIVDDNRRPLAEDALARTRAEVVAAGDALTRVHIEPGSPRALKLFSA